MGKQQICCLVAACFALQATTALAWKPITHVYLAQEAWEDAKDGTVTLHLVDYEKGTIGAKLGDFEVNPELLAAIKKYPASYFAGVLGPDAYPDILTGQMRVHPPGRGASGDPDLNVDGPGTQPWLQKLWLKAFSNEGRQPDRAFVAGYLAHAAADIFAHTYINGYAGGIFDLTTTNGLKHTILEGYIEQRTPALRPIVDSRAPQLTDPFQVVAKFGVSDGVDRFIARHTAEIGGFPNEKNRHWSLPWHFMQVRNWLDDAIKKYEKMEKEIRGPLGDWIEVLDAANTRVEWACTKHGDCPVDGGTQTNCPGWDRKRNNAGECLVQGIALAHLTAASAPIEPAIAHWRTFTSTVGAWAMMARGWRTNIDNGLVLWVQTNHRVALKLFFNPQGIKAGDALSELKSFAPIAAGMLSGIDVQVLSKLQDALKLVKAPITELEKMAKDWYDQAFKELFGISPKELQEKYASSYAFVDPMLGAGTLAKVDREMQLPASAASDFKNIPHGKITRFDWQKFPAAFNTVTMIKLSLLSEKGAKDYFAALAKVAPPAPLPRARRAHGGQHFNTMLGWGHTIDGSNQWVLGMPLADNNCVLYRRAFMRIARGPHVRERGAGHPAEPTDDCKSTVTLLTAEADATQVVFKGTVKITASEDAIFAATAGTITPCKGKPCVAQWTAPAALEERDIVVTVKPRSPDPHRPPVQVHVSVRLPLEIRVAQPPSTTAAIDLVAAGAMLRPGQRVALELASETPVTWKLEGPGQLAPAPKPRQATAIAATEKTLATDQQALAHCRDKACIDRTRASVEKAARQLSVPEQATAVGERDRQQYVYTAPSGASTATRAIIRATANDGRTVTIEFGLRARALPLPRLRNPDPVVRAADTFVLDVQPPLPVKWTVETPGGGEVGEPTSVDRKRLEQQTARIPQQVKTMKIHDPRGGHTVGSRAIARQALDRHGEEVAKQAKPLTELHALVNTYRAPPTTTPMIVTVTGVVQDGTDRKLKVRIRVTPSVAAPRGAGQAPTVVPPVRRQ